MCLLKLRQLISVRCAVCCNNDISLLWTPSALKGLLFFNDRMTGCWRNGCWVQRLTSIFIKGNWRWGFELLVWLCDIWGSYIVLFKIKFFWDVISWSQVNGNKGFHGLSHLTTADANELERIQRKTTALFSSHFFLVFLTIMLVLLSF